MTTTPRTDAEIDATLFEVPSTIMPRRSEAEKTKFSADTQWLHERMKSCDIEEFIAFLGAATDGASPAQLREAIEARIENKRIREERNGE